VTAGAGFGAATTGFGGSGFGGSGTAGSGFGGTATGATPGVGARCLPGVPASGALGALAAVVELALALGAAVVVGTGAVSAASGADTVAEATEPARVGPGRAFLSWEAPRSPTPITMHTPQATKKATGPFELFDTGGWAPLCHAAPLPVVCWKLGGGMWGAPPGVNCGFGGAMAGEDWAIGAPWPT
jgi:hypothetical protein